MTSVVSETIKWGVGVARELKGTIRHASRLARTERRAQRLVREGGELWVEVGAGDRAGRDGWLTIDMTPACDLYWDLRVGLPFPPSSISRIYSSHFLEHLTYAEGQAFLARCFEALVPEGEFSICVPNARLYVEAYLGRGPLAGRPFDGYAPAFNHTTAIDWVNYMAYMDGHHRYMFDEDNLLHVLGAAGFRGVGLRAFDLRLDLPARDFESIYAKGQR